MNTDKTQQPSNTKQRRPHIGLLYLQGLAIYLWFRLLDLVDALFRLLTTPFRWAWRLVEMPWFQLKPWLARHKRRIIWSLLALVVLSFLAGGVVTFYLWRHEAIALVVRLQGLVTRIFRKATPVINATAPVTAEDVVSASVSSSADGAGQ
jgi:hypothetical protein